MSGFPHGNLREELIDRIVRDKLMMQGQTIEYGWLVDNRLDYEKLPGHLRGPVAQMRENAEKMADPILAVMRSHLRSKQGFVAGRLHDLDEPLMTTQQCEKVAKLAVDSLLGEEQ